MEIIINDRKLTIPDTCPLDGPKKSTLRRNLQDHGVEAFLLSRKLNPFAGCLTNELLKAGAEIVDPETTELGTTEEDPDAPQISGAEIPDRGGEADQ